MQTVFVNLDMMFSIMVVLHVSVKSLPVHGDNTIYYCDCALDLLYDIYENVYFHQSLWIVTAFSMFCIGLWECFADLQP